MTPRVLIVGASASGLSVAERLRAREWDGEIVMISDDPEPPYDRPPLSKQVLAGSWEPEQTHLRTPEQIGDLRLEIMPGHAVGVDVAGHTVTLSTDETVAYDQLVLATGLRPKLPTPWAVPTGVHTIHSIGDSIRLRDEIVGGYISKLVVIGAGVLGSEIASTAKSMGAEVTVVDQFSTSMQRQLGPQLGREIQRLHERNGVRVLTDTGVQALEDRDGRVCGVVIEGETLDADAVVVAIGGAPRVEWLADTPGLAISDGVECDAYCRAGEDVFAVGDIARWFHPGLGRSIRLENRTNATQQGGAVAGNILGDMAPYSPTPYFWTDQYDVKVQVLGIVEETSEIEFVVGSPDEGRFVAVASTAGNPDAVVAWNHPRELNKLRPLIAGRFAYDGTSALAARS